MFSRKQDYASGEYKKKKKNKINFFEQTKSMFQIVEKGLRVFRMI